ncbi:MAG: ubiquitin-like domain-containing protein [Candidatus Caldarchaeales archaeon]
MRLADLAEIIRGEKSSNSESGKISLKIKVKPGQDPLTVKVPDHYTVAELEEQIVRKINMNPNNLRLSFPDGKLLPRDKRIAELADSLHGITLENAPAHIFGEEGVDECDIFYQLILK